MIPDLNIADYLTTAQFAAMVGCSTETVKKYCQDEKIEAEKVIDRWLIHRSQVPIFKQERKPRGRPPRDN